MLRGFASLRSIASIDHCMRVTVLSGSGLSADSGLPTFRGAGGLYEGMTAEEFLSASTYARDPEVVEEWVEKLRRAAQGAEPNAAHRALSDYQRRHPDTVLLTQNVDLLLERAGATEVVHLHGRLDQLRCLGRSHVIPIEGDAGDAWGMRCQRCHSRLRSNVVLFGEHAPEYERLWESLTRARATDVLVVVGTQGNVLPIGEIVRAFPGRSILNNLHESEWLEAAAFTEVRLGPAASEMEGILALLDEWRRESIRG